MDGEGWSASFLEYCTALRAYGQFRQLSFDFIGIVDTFLKNGMVPCDLLKTGLNAWGAHNDISSHAID